MTLSSGTEKRGRIRRVWGSVAQLRAGPGCFGAAVGVAGAFWEGSRPELWTLELSSAGCSAVALPRRVCEWGGGVWVGL